MRGGVWQRIAPGGAFGRSLAFEAGQRLTVRHSCVQAAVDAL